MSAESEKAMPTDEEKANAIREPNDAHPLRSDQMIALIKEYSEDLSDLHEAQYTGDTWVVVDEDECCGCISAIRSDGGYEIQCYLKDQYNKSLRGWHVRKHVRFRVEIYDCEYGDVIYSREDLWQLSDAAFEIDSRIKKQRFDNNISNKSYLACMQWNEEHADEIKEAIKPD